MSNLGSDQTAHRQRTHDTWWAVAEVSLIFLVFFLHAGWPPPGVNEPQYLAKAKHFWNPEWCPGDHFLGSADAHAVFFGTIGWLTLILSLPAVAWTVRVVSWWLLAWSWRRLSFSLVPRPLYSVLTAALFLCFSTRCHMAGEWVVGGVEGKVFAYALVWFGLAELIRGRWNRTWLLLGAGSAFHVLVGGWSVVAAGFAWLCAGKERPRLMRMLPALLAGGLLALPGLLPVLWLNHGTGPDVVRRAAEVYVFERLDHHLLLHAFRWWYIARFLGLVAVWLALAWWVPPNDRRNRLRGFVLGTMIISLVGAAIEQLTLGHSALTAQWMRFYWYRLADVAVPMGLALCLADGLVYLESRIGTAIAQWLLVAGMMLGGLSLGEHYFYNLWYRTGDPHHINGHDKHRDWREICIWIDGYVPPGECFLTPRYQQTFKWYAGRSEVVNWKDIPQDAQGIVEWHERFYDVFRTTSEIPGSRWRHSLTQIDIDTLRRLAKKYHFRYVVVDRTIRDLQPSRSEIVPICRNESFALYRLEFAGD